MRYATTLLHLWQFLRHRKKYWLLPILVVLLLLAVFILATQSSVLAPFLYPLF